MAKFILSKKKVLEQFEKVSIVSDIVSYSSKTNPYVTKILEKETDCMFSLHLTNELKNIKDMSRVLFLAQATGHDDFSNLYHTGIRNFVIDNESDLKEFLFFLNLWEDIKVNLLLRLKLRENTIRTEKYFVFGMSSEIVNEKLKELRKNKNIEKLGIHFNRKTQNTSEWNLTS